MPKHIIEFNLPEEKEELEMTMNAGKYHSTLWDFSQYLRELYKFRSDELSEAEYKFLEKIRDKFYEILNDRQLEL